MAPPECELRSQAVLGLVLVLTGLVLLYLLRHLLVDLVYLVIGFIGIVLGFALILLGLGMIFWPRGRWGRWLYQVTRFATSTFVK